MKVRKSPSSSKIGMEILALQPPWMLTFQQTVIRSSLLL
ncbi:hypothetical protein MAR_016916 [Mya arenaria]|uniref:Uncharacterized protein n=1 Tax=Mya arenaria TaxID=6604 RepID=A0ABY7EAD0_MYAAR|nr:hypothetical protein MAR_016916 [Mya arenaria]